MLGGSLDNVFFTADQHFLHNNIIKYRSQFNSAFEMGNHIIKNYNTIVSKDSVCYCLGDFSLTNASNANKLRAIRDQLNGQCILIAGNHDTFSIPTYIDTIGFDNLHLFINLFNSLVIDGVTYGIKTFVCHDPEYAEVLTNQICLCGHVHSLFKTVYNALHNVLVINVGIDVWDCKPVSVQQIIEVVVNSDFQYKQFKL